MLSIHIYVLFAQQNTLALFYKLPSVVENALTPNIAATNNFYKINFCCRVGLQLLRNSTFMIN